MRSERNRVATRCANWSIHDRVEARKTPCEQECRDNYSELEKQRFEDLPRNCEIAKAPQPIRKLHRIRKMQGSLSATV